MPTILINMYTANLLQFIIPDNVEYRMQSLMHILTEFIVDSAWIRGWEA